MKHCELNHAGRDKVLFDLKNVIYFRGLKKLVQQTVNECPLCCSTNKQASSLPLQPIYSTSAAERLIMDFTFFPPGRNNACTLLIVIDHFTKRIWYSIGTTKESKYVVELLETIANELTLLGLGNTPLTLVQSDNGKEFIANDVVSVIEKFGGKAINSMPYHPQTNGAVERFNQTIKSMIVKRLAEQVCELYTNI